MLSTSVIKNVSDASHYYAAHDNYYTREEGIAQSEWFGKGAEKLSLRGEVSSDRFTSLLEGRLPDGEQLGKMVDGKIKHRAGWDLTFSAPKSVSILALIGGDQRLIEAHRSAVKVTLAEIERGCSEARFRINGDMVYQNTQNLLAALYHHDLSREQDPQLHTHGVIMNMTERSDGKWRSQASKIGRYDKETASEVHGFIERVRHHKRYYGKLYEAELAFQVKELGYEIAVNQKTGVFEIVGVPEEINRYFSKRRDKIEQHLTENGLSSSRAAEVAAIKTRHHKEIVDRETLSKQWKEEATDLGFNGQSIIEKAHTTLILSKENAQTEPSVESNLLSALKEAGKELSQFKTTFLLEEVIALAAKDAIDKKISVETLLKTADHLIKTGDFTSLQNERDKTLLMDKSTLDDEKEIIQCLNEAKIHKQLIPTNFLTQYLAQQNEIAGDVKEAVQQVFSHQRYVLVEGESAKEVLSKSIVQVAKAAKLELAIVSPSPINSKKLAEDLKNKPKTIWEQIRSFFHDDSIKNYSMTQFFSGTNLKSADVLLVDKSHLLSTHQLKNLLFWGKVHDKQVILFANKNVLLSQKRSISTDYLIQQGIKIVEFAEQKGSLHEDVTQHNIQSIAQKISTRLIEVNHSDERLIVMAKHYSRLENPKSAFLVANNKISAERLNQFTHDELKMNGKLGKGFSIKVLQPHFLSESAAKNAGSYCRGDWVRFNNSNKSLSIRQGDYLQIKSHDKERNQVLLVNSRNKNIFWYPDKKDNTNYVEYFKEKGREFCVGECIQFNRSLRFAKITKGEHFTIHSITQNKIKLMSENGKRIMIDLNKSYQCHFDYGYAHTPHQLVHEKPTQLIAELPSQSFHTDKRLFFQVVSQSKEIWIYTDNQSSLFATLEKKSGNKLSATQTLQQAENLKRSFHSLYDVLEKIILNNTKEINSLQLSKVAIDAVDYAIKHLTEREAGFTHKELMLTAIQHTLGEVNPQVMAETISAMEKAHILLKGKRSDGTLWTTCDAVNIERQIIAICHQDKGQLEPIANDAMVAQFCVSQKLHPEQIAAIQSIIQSKDRVLAIQGKAGTGKTTLMTTLADIVSAKDIFNHQGYELQGLAPTHSAAKELTSRGIKAQTLDSFLLEMQKVVSHASIKTDLSKKIIILDEASMVSNRKMLELLKLGSMLNIRMIITVGDTRQLPSIEAGKPQALIQTQVQSISLENIRRQENAALKKAVKETYEYNFAEALKTLKESMIEIGDNQIGKGLKNKQENRSLGRLERIKALVADYINIKPEQRSNTLVITPGHEDRVLTNALIREQLKQEGTLAGNEYSFPILSAKSMTQVEKSHIKHFETGQVIRFNTANGQHKAGDYLTVIKVLDQHHMLVLKNQQGKEMLWQVPRSQTRLNHVIEVFKQEERQLQVGDSIRWARTDKLNHLFSSEIAKVTALQKDDITLQFDNQKQLSFDPKNPAFQHWDHAYALTVYAAQGSTKQTVLALLESYRENLVNQPAFLVALTRAVDQFRIYTDNIKALLTRIEQNSGIKLSSLEVIGKYPRSNPKIKNKDISDLNNTANQKHYIVQQIVESLNQDAEKIATSILGEPIARTSHYLQFGSNKGSLRVTIHGSKQGLWNDFSGDVSNQGKTGGNMLQFLQVFGGMTKKEAVEYGAKQYGYSIDASPSILNKALSDWQKQAHKKREEQLKAEKINQQHKIEFAKNLAEQSQPIKGTLAERYLKEHRGILLETYPDDIRYHPGIYSKLNGQTFPAMLVVVRDGKGEIKAVQATYLDPQTAAKVDKSKINIQKQTFGVLMGAAVSVTGKDKNTALIAEGVETGLSLAKAIPDANVKIVLGKSNFLHIDTISTNKNIILCLDNDGKNIREDKIIFESAKRLVEGGKSVRLAMPTALKNDKQDYNDVLKKVGADPVCQDIKEAVSFERFYQPSTINLLSISSETDQKVARYVNEVAKASHRKERDLVNIQHEIQNPIIEKSLTKEISFDREI